MKSENVTKLMLIAYGVSIDSRCSHSRACEMMLLSVWNLSHYVRESLYVHLYAD